MKLFKRNAIILIVPLLIGVFNFWIDPLQFYRRTTWYAPRFYTEQRYQVPGIARNFDYDTVILGTSMSENISLAALKEDYGINAVRLTASGSSAYEQRLALDVALRTGKVKRVIWDVNFCSLSGGETAVRDLDAAFPMYLYDGNFMTDFMYLLNPAITRMSITNYIYRKPYDEGKAREDFEKLNTWHNWYNFGSEPTLESFDKMKEEGMLEPDEFITQDYEWDKLTANADKNILDMIRNNPDVEFLCYLPPFSYLEHVGHEMQGIFDEELRMRQYIFDKCQEISNVKLFDFQAREEVVSNLENYKDKAHHSIEIMEWVVEELLTGEETGEKEFVENQVWLEEVVRDGSM